MIGEYWGFPGTDIESVATLAPMTPSRIGIWSWQDKNAARALQTCLEFVRTGVEVSEVSHQNEESFNPSSDQYPPGSVLVLDWEKLKMGPVFPGLPS